MPICNYCEKKFDVEKEPGALMFGMLCCNISAGIWLNLATYFKFPVSTTHSIIGAILGFALAYGGSESNTSLG